jgi:iron(III) transport system ATP-binding protein
MSILSVKNISKSFGQSVVLNDINFELNNGEFFSVVGPSGCGKTTLLRIIAGLEFPTNGEIFIQDKDATDFSPQKRNVGIVFQNYALFPNMTVFENVAYGLSIKKTEKNIIQKKNININESFLKNVTTLSGGEQQRVSLARVIVTEPALLLFDEPLSNLDYALRLETRNEIKRLQKEIGITSMYVTHDQSEALALSDRIAVLNKGVIQQIGTPYEVYNHPGNFFTADFIGHANFFNKETAGKIFNVTDLNEDELLAVFPEEIIPVKCTEYCKAKITDVQYSGFFTEYLIDSDGKQIKSMIASGSNNEIFNTDENVNLKLTSKVIRKIKG